MATEYRLGFTCMSSNKKKLILKYRIEVTRSRGESGVEVSRGRCDKDGVD